MQKMLEQSIQESTTLLRTLGQHGERLQQLGTLMIDCWKSRGKVLIAGNGGSMADAMHFSEELTVRYKKNRKALAAIALCDPAAITCAGNDFGFDTIFERQVEALGQPGDVLIVFSTSGSSRNVVKAVEYAGARQMKTVSFLGGTGGLLAGRCDIEFIIPTTTTARIQEMHKLLFHTVCEWLDATV